MEKSRQYKIEAIPTQLALVENSETWSASIDARKKKPILTQFTLVDNR